MRQFKSNDKIVAITSKDCKYAPRVAGKEYVVLGTHNCKKCGEQWLCVHEVNMQVTRKIVCSSCGYDELNSNNPWVSAKHFRLANDVENKDVLMIRLNNAIQCENYEEAAQLRDKINSI
jgi:protein-arginine kinase activator protein McsA